MRRCTCSVEWFLAEAAIDRSIDISSRVLDDPTAHSDEASLSAAEFC